MKIFNIIFSILFLVSAGLQYNDPDPYIWVPIYLFVAILCWQAARNKFYPRAYIFGILAFAAYALYYVFTDNGVLDWIQKHEAENIAATMKATKPWIEDAREFFGLLILIGVLSVNLIYSKKKSRRFA